MIAPWVLKQDRLRVGVVGWDEDGGNLDEWTALADGELRWRGPSNPPDTVHHVHAGDLILTWDIRKRVVWEASIATGWTSVETWYDHVDERDRTGPGLWLVRVAAFPYEPTEDEARAITVSQRLTLNRLKPDVGADLWRWVVDEASKYRLGDTD